jgi:hypothetical protein
VELSTDAEPKSEATIGSGVWLGHMVELQKTIKFLDSLCISRLPKSFRCVAAQCAYDLNQSLNKKYRVKLSEKCVNPLNWF